MNKFEKLNKLKALAPKYVGHTMHKFFADPVLFNRMAIEILADLGDVDKGAQVLDLGGGIGYFASVCNENGAHAVVLDNPAEAWSEGCAINEVEFVGHNITPEQLVPTDVIHKDWDLITTFGVNFETNGVLWGVKEYGHLIGHMWPSLKMGGRWAWRPNKDVLPSWRLFCKWFGNDESIDDVYATPAGTIVMAKASE